MFRSFRIRRPSFHMTANSDVIIRDRAHLIGTSYPALVAVHLKSDVGSR